MADPLSLAAGVVGIATAAVQITSLLTKFTKSTISAPRHAQIVLSEVSDIGGIVSLLQSYVLGIDSSERSRTGLLKVKEVVTIVSGCVLTFSELEKLLDEMKVEDMDILACLKWARKESAMMGIIQRLQHHKASLSLVLSILNGHTVAEAKDSVERLHIFVEKCYKDISARMQALEVPELRDRGEAESRLGDDTESLATIRAYPSASPNSEVVENEAILFDFSDDLQRSRVYRRNQAFRNSVISDLTNSVHSVGWSFFSDLSMAEVSNISAINLAITEGEAFNPQRSSQTWSAQTNQGASTGHFPESYGGGKRTQMNHAARKAVPADDPSITQGLWPESTPEWQPSLTQARPLSTLLASPHNSYPSDSGSSLWQNDQFLERNSARNADTPVRNFSLPLSVPLDPPSPSQLQPTSSQPHEPENDELFHPCKGCGEILEERKAFKLDCDHWHIVCVRCNICNIFLDSSTNLVLFNDGSRLCHNCTYECGDCRSTIEDLPILTGNQAFCNACFKCQGCNKKKTEAFKYTETPQGIFCDECLQSWMPERAL